MTQHIVVREYAQLCIHEAGSPRENTLDCASVSPSAFAWLCELAASFRKSGASLCLVESRYRLRLDNYVGILATPCGTVVEILPKLTANTGAEATQDARAILIKMLNVALELPKRSAAPAALQTMALPLQEWVMWQFIQELEIAVKRGLRFDYQRIEDEQRFLRGQLDMAKQMRHAPTRGHLFALRHDVFLPDCAENRLLKAALIRVCNNTGNGVTWRLAHELANLMSEIHASVQISNDFRQWRTTRIMAHYQALRPWCELVLGQHMPVALSGQTQGISLLFPMERLFERYVETSLQKQLLGTGFQIKRQPASQYLCKTDQGKHFLLKPDMLLQRNRQTCMVLDAKWKLLSNKEKNGGLQQSDFYQMFAYGHKYLEGKGEMLLIYPKNHAFSEPMARFEYAPGLNLHVAAFDLKADKLIELEGYLSLFQPEPFTIGAVCN